MSQSQLGLTDKYKKNTFQPSSVGSGAGDKRAPITQLLTVGSNATLNEPEENLAAYFEPFGSALIPCAPGARDSIASCESDSLLVAEKKNSDETEQEVRFLSPKT